jgi:predicted transcriptional regulator
MAGEAHTWLSRRERQIMDSLYRRGRATVSEVLADLPDPPSYSAVRAIMRLLEEKGHLGHDEDGPRYVYFPTVDRNQASKSALTHVLQTFFDGSASRAVAALLDETSAKLSDDELDSLSKMIEQARKE